jgi:hypothetical protein
MLVGVFVWVLVGEGLLGWEFGGWTNEIVVERWRWRGPIPIYYYHPHHQV